VPEPVRDDDELARAKPNLTVAQTDHEVSLDDIEQLIFGRVWFASC